MQNQQNRNQMTQEAMSAAIGQIAQMYQGQKQKKDTLKGMDTTVMAMSDIGAITPVSYTHLTLPTKRIV